MATPVYNNAGQTGVADGGASTVTLASFAANSGSNRFLEVWAGSGDGTPQACTGVTWGGQALTQRGNTQSGTYWRHNKWYLKEADFPGGATGDIVATYAGNVAERAICAIVHSDVDQSSPYRNASQTEEVDTVTNTPSVGVTSNADDVVTAGVYAGQTASGITAIATTAGTERCDTGPLAGGYEIASASTVAGAGTATITWSISNGTTSDWNAILADSLQGQAAGSTLPTGRADETDTALGLTRRKAKAAQLATETDTALALTAAHARATGLASETDSALALAKLKAKATGLASETETALALVRVKAKPVGLATETDNALAVSAVKTRSTGRADETDTALAPGAPLGVGIASETDSAFALACLKSKVAQVATTTETALALTARKVRLCGTAAETDTALGLAAQKIRACGRADESDTALARPPLGVIVRPVGLAIETDEALALEPAQREEEAATGGWAHYFRAEQAALRRKHLRALAEEAEEASEREALAEALETALIADGTATQGDVDRLRLDQIAALYTDRTLLDRRAQRALAYAERSRTELATRLALRELQRQQEDEELAVLLVLAID